MTRFVNKKEVARVVKILTDELVGLKFELYFIVAFDLSRNVTGAEIYPHLIRTKRQLRRLRRRCFTRRLDELPGAAKLDEGRLRVGDADRN